MVVVAITRIAERYNNPEGTVTIYLFANYLGCSGRRPESNTDGFVTLEGAIPSEIGQLTKLTRLDLGGTQLSGARPENSLCVRVYVSE
jgi:hypothetical protein